MSFPATKRHPDDGRLLTLAYLPETGAAVYVWIPIAGDFPMTVTDRGRVYRRTDKLGWDRVTGHPSAEYADTGDRRCWADRHGNVTEVG